MKITRFLFLFVAVLLAVYLSSVPNATSGPGSETIKLPQPSLDDGISVERALRDRRSVRNFSPLPLALKDLSQLLWAAQGITGLDGRRTSPSAGALYPLEVYVIAGRVAGLASGIYTYNPAGHGLLKISDDDARADLSTAAQGQTSVRSAPAVLVIAAVYERTMVKYGERGSASHRWRQGTRPRTSAFRLSRGNSGVS